MLVASVLLVGIGWMVAVLACYAHLVGELRGLRDEMVRGNRTTQHLVKFVTGGSETIRMTEAEIAEARGRPTDPPMG